MSRKRHVGIAGLVLCLSLLAGRAGAWVPADWVYMAGTHAYSSPVGGWVFLNPGDTQWVCDMQTGAWSQLGQSPVDSGWLYFAWPYAYSIDHAGWYYFLPGDTQYVYSHPAGTWGILGHVQQMAGNVPFLRQVDNYTSGYGEPGEDWIVIDSITGPSGATVSNQKNGAYTVRGSYRLSTFPTARISLLWGGTTNYSTYQPFDIAAAGQGTFVVQVTKTSGGSGNLFLTMASGGSWMFDTVPVNTAPIVMGDAGGEGGLAASAGDTTGDLVLRVPRVYCER